MLNLTHRSKTSFNLPCFISSAMVCLSLSYTPILGAEPVLSRKINANPAMNDTLNTPLSSTYRNVLHLSTTASSPVTPDTAVITLFAELSGSDSAVITKEINQMIAEGLSQAQSNKLIEASTGQFSTYQQYNHKGIQTGWTVRSELILKSKDFGVLGQLAGALNKKLKIANNHFEVSKRLLQQEEELLLNLGLEQFKKKAQRATQTLGFSTYTLNEVHLDQAALDNVNQPPMYMMAKTAAVADSAPQEVPIQANSTTLNLTVRGSITLE